LDPGGERNENPVFQGSSLIGGPQKERTPKKTKKGGSIKEKRETLID